MNLLAMTGLLIAGVWVFLVARSSKLPQPKALPARVGINRQQYDAAIQALESSLANGELSAAEAAQERTQLQLQLVRAAESDTQAAAWTSSVGAPVRVAFLILPLSISVLVFFATNGAMHWPSSAAPRNAGVDTPPDIQQMVSRLAQRLEENPEDPVGWTMLGRSYMVMQRFDEAAQAWNEANKRSPQPVPDYLVAEAEALGMAQDRSLEGRPMELINQALSLDPQNIRGLWFFALAAQARGDEDQAFRTLEELAQVPALPQELIDTLVEIGVDVPQASSQSAAGYALNVQVQLGESLRKQTPPGSTIFVFARTPSGPPMPVAAQRLPIGAWPAAAVLDDSSSMMAGRLISEQSDLEIVARISSSGTAKASPGDWEGRSRWSNTPGGGQVTVTIDTVVP